MAWIKRNQINLVWLSGVMVVCAIVAAILVYEANLFGPNTIFPEDIAATYLGVLASAVFARLLVDDPKNVLLWLGVSVYALFVLVRLIAPLLTL